MGYTPLELERPLAIDRIYSVHYFEYGPDYAFVGESHDFWELVYADKGEVYVTAGEEEKLLKKGQMSLPRSRRVPQRAGHRRRRAQHRLISFE